MSAGSLLGHGLQDPLGMGRLALSKYCHPEIGKPADFKTNYTLAITASLIQLPQKLSPGS